MSILVIGDIHGCFVELQELLDKAGLTSDDTILALGDIVDRGPETPQVLEFFRSQPQAMSLQGNHERKHLRAASRKVKLSLAQVIARAQFGETYPEVLEFLEAFPIYLELPEATLVHGYVEPGVRLSKQRETVLCGTMSGERYLQTHYERPWYELYTGSKPLIAGHRDYLHNGQPLIYQDRVFCLDTSCVHGKRLSGLLLPEFQVISVPSHGNHWYETRRQYRLQHPVTRKPPCPRRTLGSSPSAILPWDETADMRLQALLDHIKVKNKQLMGQVQSQPGYVELTPRLQAKAYSAALARINIGVAEPLFHLERKGVLDATTARRIIHSPEWLSHAEQNLGMV